MQYKIPVQIENEDPIILWLSLRQLTILIIGSGIWYAVFKSLLPSMWAEVAAIPWIIIAAIALLIAVFKHTEMTFVPFVLNILRFNTNWRERVWVKWVDSYQPIDIGFISNATEKDEGKIDFQDKIDKIKDLDDKLNKI
jgi:hypothetical protein